MLTEYSQASILTLYSLKWLNKPFGNTLVYYSVIIIEV